MPVTPHIERHFTATEMVRDIVIGMADGLTVPFALAAGISGAGASTHIVVTAWLALSGTWTRITYKKMWRRKYEWQRMDFSLASQHCLADRFRKYVYLAIEPAGN
jgi:hypothetical protein